ncbi:site-2 protease family protein [Priestia taiwanensis]|uniref:Site-2 protease family protein n=1 Tax=Priestia taiwanensis TaxID=1347902 RepID=A0A917EKU3_9BACI|nr:site-2 protease family protein [Priestia taiwanensis]MBM7361555.1 Zn-dependent protease [Priestia taiwanensis]GGE55142.1 site-2 protease family protein [Priestia taiwanensis]
METVEKKTEKKLKWGTVGVIGVLVLTKLKWVLSILKFLKIPTTISMILSLFAYGLVYGWMFAVAIIYLLFVHEMGHLWATKRIGLKTSSAIFIPFVGAFIGLKEMPKNAKDEAFVGYMGPLFGLFSILPAIILYLITDEPFFGLVIALGALINLFNLMPVSPLDGGRIISVVSTKLWIIGLMMLGVYTYMTGSGFLVFILIIGAMTWWERVTEEKRLGRLQVQIDVHEKYIQPYREYFESKEEWRMPFVYVGVEVKRRHNYFLEEKIFPVKEERVEEIVVNLFYDAFHRSAKTEEELEEAYGKRCKELQELKDEKDRTKHYYVATPKVRWTYFLAYVLLVATLGGLHLYGQEIIDLDMFIEENR